MAAGYPLSSSLRETAAELRLRLNSAGDALLPNTDKKAWFKDIYQFFRAFQSEEALSCLVLSEVSALTSLANHTMLNQLEDYNPIFFARVLTALKNESEITTWDHIIRAFEALEREHNTPPHYNTQVRGSSARFPDSTTRGDMEKALVAELQGRLLVDVPNFIDVHFSMEDWSQEQTNMYNSLLTHHENKRWTGFPTESWEDEVWKWLKDLESSCLQGAPNMLFTNKTSTEFKEKKGQFDFFIQLATTKIGEDGKYDHANVLVVGEHKKTLRNHKFRDTFAQLARYVRNVFSKQPLRRFIHAFTFQGTVVQLFIFDRSGCYASESFDIHNKPGWFAQVLVGYATMNEFEMGGPDFFKKKKWGKKGKYISFQPINSKGSRFKLRLKDENLFFSQHAIVCRGTICFKVHSNSIDGVVKLSWQYMEMTTEIRLLQKAQAAGVKGVAQLRGYVTELAHTHGHREGLEAGTVKALVANDNVASGSFSPAGTASPAASSGSSRKRDSGQAHHTDDEQFEPTSKRRSTGSNSATLREFGLRTPIRNLPSVRPDQVPDRFLGAICIEPAGEAITDFTNENQLLRVIQHAIIGHKELFKAGILHRDISTNNIIITNPKAADGFHGILIDLDHACDINESEDGQVERTGTLQFMAVDVLNRSEHTYIQDLQSFLYVLIWLCAEDAWKKPAITKEESRGSERPLKRWFSPKISEIIQAKQDDMTTKKHFEALLNAMPTQLQKARNVCGEMRRVLFGGFGYDKRVLGKDYDRIYELIDRAFAKQLGESK